MKKPKVMVVCGFGLGSSMILRLKLDTVLKKHGLAANTFCADAMTAKGEHFDIVFTSKELVDTFAGIPQPVVVIQNFMSEAEIAEKGVPAIEALIESA
ncbi:MAG: PTS sugar transporter subunit IIB [Anaerolineales bacterium]